MYFLTTRKNLSLRMFMTVLLLSSAIATTTPLCSIYTAPVLSFFVFAAAFRHHLHTLNTTPALVPLHSGAGSVRQ